MTQSDNQNPTLEQLGILVGEWNNSNLKTKRVERQT
jgi:hypothetical protein